MGIVDNFKDLFKVADSINNLELYRKLSELQTRAIELEEENRSLKERLATKENLVFEDDKYWLTQDGRKDGPYCNVCWDIDTKLVRMVNSEFYGVKSFVCDYCARHRSRGHSKSRSGD